MRILVTFAVEAEFAPWRKLRDLRVMKVAKLPSAKPKSDERVSISSSPVWAARTRDESQML